MGRSISTLCDELKRNPVKGIYSATKAQQKAYARRRASKFQSMRIVQCSALRLFVEKALSSGQSPENIAGRISTHEHSLPRVSKNTIYRYLQSPYGRKLVVQRLQSKKKPRKQRSKVTTLADRTFIDQRPEHINTRSGVGDVEADFIVSGKKGYGILLVIVDRKLRICFIEQILSVSIVEVHRAFLRIKKRYPELRSCTTDNDLLFQKHKELEELLSIDIYFCHPYHSWEKGTVENTNKHIRDFIPKGANISQYSPEFIRTIENCLNSRYMKCLGYSTPTEVLELHRTTVKKKYPST